jgi:hypothetical protein
MAEILGIGPGGRLAASEPDGRADRRGAKGEAAAIVAEVKRLVGPDTLGWKLPAYKRFSPSRAHRHSTAHPTAGGAAPALKVD